MMSRDAFRGGLAGTRMGPSAAVPVLTLPKPAHSGGRVLYLDFDGVLHPENVWRRPGAGPYVATPPGHRVFELAPLLAQALEPYPDLRIVLATSWVRVLSFTQAARRLPAGLRARVIGATYHSRMEAAAFLEMPRGVQILADVSRRRPAAWLALDDDTEGWPPLYRAHLVRTHAVLGISAPEVFAELRDKLAGLYRERAAGCEPVKPHDAGVRAGLTPQGRL
jgi:hypothetical protein